MADQPYAHPWVSPWTMPAAWQSLPYKKSNRFSSSSSPSGNVVALVACAAFSMVGDSIVAVVVSQRMRVFEIAQTALRRARDSRNERATAAFAAVFGSIRKRPQ